MAKSSKILFVILLLGLACSQTVDLNTIFTPETQATLGSEYEDAAFLRKIDNYFGCKTWQNGFCIECSFGYIFNSNGVCCEIDQNCQVFNRDVGVCEQCYTGYYINAEGTCTAYSAEDSSVIGCGQWSNGECVACSAKYYLGEDNVCHAVSSQCRNWNTTTGQCTSCYYGYNVVEGACVQGPAPLSSNVAANPLCKSWVDSTCDSCAIRSYFNEDGICTKISDSCWTYDQVDGFCLTCYSGYDLVNGTCVYSESNTAATTDEGCRTWEDGICLQCSTRWVFNALGFCVSVEDSCRTFDETGLCLTCYLGYTLVDGTCQWSSTNQEAPIDPGCRVWNGSICEECSTNWVLNSNGICLPVSDECRTHDSNGECTGCYRGYNIVNGSCEYNQNYLASTQSGCHIWDWETLSCQQCSSWWFLNANGVCQEVSAYCAAYNGDGTCSSCYRGYALTEEGVCVVSVAEVKDKGCKTWNESTCEECSYGYVFNLVGSCIVVSDQCKTYNSSNGECTSCYNGYHLTNGSCLYSQEAVATGGCKTWEWNNRVCEECASNWILVNGACVAVSDQCREYNSNGWCTSCYRGYDLHSILNENQEVISVACQYSTSNVAALSDEGCHIWNWTTNTCQECASNWYFSNGACVQSNTYCRSFNTSNGFCLSCYKGYDLTSHYDNETLISVTCEYGASNTASPSDPGCRQWNGSICSVCSTNYEFNDNGVCQQVSDSCKTHQGLACTSCYHGFVLNNGTCELNPLNSVAPSDAGCNDWDWFSQVCNSCSPYWYMSNGVCLPVSAYCKTYDQNGECTSCFKGYSIINGSCVRTADKVVTDAGCKNWIWDNNTCTQCSPYWYFNEGVCTSVSPYCKTYNLLNGQCTSCYSGYSLNDGICSTAPASFCKSSDENGCLSCYEGYVLYQDNCVTLDSIANIALYYAECCPEKLAELQAEGRIPQ